MIWLLTSHRVDGMVKMQRKRSEAAKVPTKTFRAVLMASLPSTAQRMRMLPKIPKTIRIEQMVMREQMTYSLSLEFSSKFCLNVPRMSFKLLRLDKPEVRSIPNLKLPFSKSFSSSSDKVPLDKSKMELVKQYRETTFSQQIDTALTTEYLIIFFQMGHPRTLFVYFGSFQANFREKYVGFSRI